MTAPGGEGDFKDHFSEVAAAYAAHRPTYPPALVDLLARLAPARRLAWDAGCGSGQLSRSWPVRSRVSGRRMRAPSSSHARRRTPR